MMGLDRRRLAWWIARLLFVAACGLVCGYVAVYRSSPAFLSNERIMAAWAADRRAEKDKDPYLLLLYARLKPRITDERNRPLIPLLLPVLLRADRLNEFEELARRVPPAERGTDVLTQAVLTCVRELVEHGEQTRFARVWPTLQLLAADNPALSLGMGDTNSLNAILGAGAELTRVIGDLEQKLMKGPCPDDDPDLARLRELANLFLAHADDAAELTQKAARRQIELLLCFTVRAAGYRGGSFAQLGDLLIRSAQPFERPTCLFNGSYATVLMMQNTPARWPEWRTFAERLVVEKHPSLRCLGAYSLGFLAYADNRPAEARRKLADEVVTQSACEGVLQQLAGEQIARIDRGERLSSRP